MTPEQQLAARDDNTRDHALEHGLPLYLGTPCARGHKGWRYTAGQHCYECPDGLEAVPLSHSRPVHKVDGVWHDVGTGDPLKMPDMQMPRELAKVFGFEVYWSADGEGWTLV